MERSFVCCLSTEDPDISCTLAALCSRPPVMYSDQLLLYTPQTIADRSRGICRAFEQFLQGLTPNPSQYKTTEQQGIWNNQMEVK